MFFDKRRERFVFFESRDRLGYGMCHHRIILLTSRHVHLQSVEFPDMAYVYPYLRRETASGAYYAQWVVLRAIDAGIGIVMFLLALRFVLVLLGANAGNSFMQWLYGVTGQLIAPFSNIFSSWNLGGLFVVEWTTVFAMIAYGILGYFIIRVVGFLMSSFRVV